MIFGKKIPVKIFSDRLAKSSMNTYLSDEEIEFIKKNRRISKITNKHKLELLIIEMFVKLAAITLVLREYDSVLEDAIKDRYTKSMTPYLLEIGPSENLLSKTATRIAEYDEAFIKCQNGGDVLELGCLFSKNIVGEEDIAMALFITDLFINSIKLTKKYINEVMSKFGIKY